MQQGHGQDKDAYCDYLMQVPGEPNYHQLFADLEKEMEKMKEDAADHARMLHDEALKAKEDASSARAERARVQADAAFEKQRSDRLAEHLEEQRLQMQQLTGHSSKYQVLDLHTSNQVGVEGIYMSLCPCDKYNINSDQDWATIQHTCLWSTKEQNANS